MILSGCYYKSSKKCVIRIVENRKYIFIDIEEKQNKEVIPRLTECNTNLYIMENLLRQKKENRIRCKMKMNIPPEIKQLQGQVILNHLNKQTIF